MARPGGAEILCGGTLALLRERGYGVHIAVVTAGDSGAGGDNASEAARTRVAEARSAAGRIRAGFTCFGRQDFHVTSDLASLDEVVELIRSIEPLLVVTNAPENPLPDREISSLLARQACLAASAPHYDTAHRPAHHATHHDVSLYYAAPVAGRRPLRTAGLVVAVHRHFEHHRPQVRHADLSQDPRQLIRGRRRGWLGRALASGKPAARPLGRGRVRRGAFAGT